MAFEKIKTLYEIQGEEFGNSISEIIQVEKELGINLPPIMREFYQLFGKHKIIVHDESPRALTELFINDEGYLEIFLNQMTGARWAIDPNNTTSTLFTITPTGKWYPIKASIKDFLLSEIYWASCTRLACRALGAPAIDLLELKIETGQIELLKINADFSNLRFYQSSPNNIFALQDNLISLGSNNKADFAAALAIFEKTWLPSFIVPKLKEE